MALVYLDCQIYKRESNKAIAFSEKVDELTIQPITFSLVASHKIVSVSKQHTQHLIKRKQTQESARQWILWIPSGRLHLCAVKMKK